MFIFTFICCASKGFMKALKESLSLCPELGLERKMLCLVFCQELYEKLSFLIWITKFISRCKILQNIKMPNLVTLKYGLLNINQNSKRSLLFRSEVGIFQIFFKRLNKESFEDLPINSNWKFKTRATTTHKMAAL